MTPGKEDEEKFGEDVGIGHVEVVLQGGYGNIAVELRPTGSILGQLFFGSFKDG
jgi:hypothetical protein